MLTLIIVLVSGIIVAIFATQNTQPVSVSFLNYQLTSIPLYGVVLGAILFGIFVSWLISMVDTIASHLTIHGKNKTISAVKKESTDLTKRVHQLEIENERLKTELHMSGDDKSL